MRITRIGACNATSPFRGGRQVHPHPAATRPLKTLGHHGNSLLVLPPLPQLFPHTSKERPVQHQPPIPGQLDHLRQLGVTLVVDTELEQELQNIQGRLHGISLSYDIFAGTKKKTAILNLAPAQIQSVTNIVLYGCNHKGVPLCNRTSITY